MRAQLLCAELSGCVVSASQAGRHGGVSPSSDGLWSCSGVIVEHNAGIAICQGAVFFPFLKEGTFSYSDRTVLLATDFPADLLVQVEFPLESTTDAKLWDAPVRQDTPGRPRLDLIPLSGPWSQRARCQADLLLLLPCPEFQATFSRLFKKEDGWVFSSEDQNEYGEFQKDLTYLHWFAVLKLQSPPIRDRPRLGIRSSSDLVKGSTVFACGSPFGAFYPDIFLNTLSKGLLSNMAGDRNVLLVTDARCLPGSEGGGIYLLENGNAYLIGMTVAPLCWKSNEWVGLTLACSISHIFENIMKTFGMVGHVAKSELAALEMAAGSIVGKYRGGTGPLDHLMAAVVVVDSGQSWGSGVLIQSDLVLTCRHVVRHCSKVSVKVWPASKNQLHWMYQSCRPVRGQVVFASHESSPYDIAVVKLEKEIVGVPEPVLASSYYLGQDICIIGFGALGERCGPSITSGILSAVISVADVPVMLQTSCAVHGGSSGGPVFDVQSGELLGIVASNTKDNSTGATYPHLNFSIPITILREAIDNCKKSGDLKHFGELNSAAAAVQNVWRLQRSPENVFQSKL
ncbi:peroxisomal leader peptide-processing protease [Gastrophryne carolinensis]